MKTKRSFGWKQILCAAAAVALLVAAGFGINALSDRGSVPAQTAEAKLSQQGAAPAETTNAPAENTLPAEETDPPVTRKAPVGYISDDEVRVNSLLTFIVQQNVENSETDLDDDAELVRFVFSYRKYYQSKSVIEQENDDGVSCRTLTLEQVNETLDLFFGRTVSPDREDYSILNEEGEGFHCVFRDGCFWNVPPYPTAKYDFPVRFALVDKIDEKTSTVHFRLYRTNPDSWGAGEAERHVPLLPMLSLYEAENGDGDAKTWISKIGEGTAVLSVSGDDLKLVKMTTSLY